MCVVGVLHVCVVAGLFKGFRLKGGKLSRNWGEGGSRDGALTPSLVCSPEWVYYM